MSKEKSLSWGPPPPPPLLGSSRPGGGWGSRVSTLLVLGVCAEPWGCGQIRLARPHASGQVSRELQGQTVQVPGPRTRTAKGSGGARGRARLWPGQQTGLLCPEGPRLPRTGTDALSLNRSRKIWKSVFLPVPSQPCAAEPRVGPELREWVCPSPTQTWRRCQGATGAPGRWERTEGPPRPHCPLEWPDWKARGSSKAIVEQRAIEPENP